MLIFEWSFTDFGGIMQLNEMKHNDTHAFARSLFFLMHQQNKVRVKPISSICLIS